MAAVAAQPMAACEPMTRDGNKMYSVSLSSDILNVVSTQGCALVVKRFSETRLYNQQNSTQVSKIEEHDIFHKNRAWGAWGSNPFPFQLSQTHFQ